MFIVLGLTLSHTSSQTGGYCSPAWIELCLPQPILGTIQVQVQTFWVQIDKGRNQSTIPSKIVTAGAAAKCQYSRHRPRARISYGLDEVLHSLTQESH